MRSDRVTEATIEVARVLARYFPRASAEDVGSVCEVCVNVMATLLAVTTNGSNDDVFVRDISRMFQVTIRHRRAREGTLQ